MQVTCEYGHDRYLPKSVLARSCACIHAGRGMTCEYAKVQRPATASASIVVLACCPVYGASIQHTCMTGSVTTTGPTSMHCRPTFALSCRLASCTAASFVTRPIGHGPTAAEAEWALPQQSGRTSRVARGTLGPTSPSAVHSPCLLAAAPWLETPSLVLGRAPKCCAHSCPDRCCC